MSQSRNSATAVETVVRLVRRLGIDGIDPRTLHESQHISIRLHPLDVVARVTKVGKAANVEILRRELSVARHLANKCAPIVRPITELPAGPHFDGGYGLTLWQFVSHVPADEDNPAHVRSAAKALRAVHGALADFPEALPPFWTKLGECRELLEDESALPALGAADRAFLLATYERLRGSLMRRPMKVAPIHGDAHLDNVLITPDGALWNDFEDVCLGPREWDIGSLPEADLAPFEPIEHEALSLLQYMRSLCISVWCWALFDRPEKREAAEYHLGRLKEHFTQSSGS